MKDRQASILTAMLLAPLAAPTLQATVADGTARWNALFIPPPCERCEATVKIPHLEYGRPPGPGLG